MFFILILEMPVAVTVEFDPTSYTVSESGRFANITVVKRGLAAGPVSVNFATTDGSAVGEHSCLVDKSTCMLCHLLSVPCESVLRSNCWLPN